MSQWYNDEQDAHMRSLASIPREQRCRSGWHVVAEEKCYCGPYEYPSGAAAQEGDRNG